tara:strand:+ start:27 stop:353 length:327 start_codon:yes stop_codon:yes gene_type:complete
VQALGKFLQNVLSLSFDMKSATTRTFSGLASFDVDLHSSSYSDDSRITLRDTNSGDKLEMEGITNTVLRSAVLSYVSYMGYRKEDASAREFLHKLSDQLASALEKEEA